MNRYEKLMQRIASGERIMIDGATGTEIERRGVRMVENGWNGGGALTDPEIVRAVHEEYIRTGAEVIISNTFSTSRHVLEDAGLAEHFDLLNRRGVELAIEARDQMNTPDVLVAGGITGVTFTDRHPPAVEQARNFADQAAIMAKAGADLLMLEMMIDVERTLIILDAAQGTGLPIWLGFSARPDKHGTVRLNAGPTLQEGLDAIADRNVPLINIMHTEVEDVDACLDVLQQNWSGPIGVYAHSGDFVPPNWIFDGTITPAEYTAYAQGWLARGVQVIGGCCGVGSEHMHHLHDALVS